MSIIVDNNTRKVLKWTNCRNSLEYYVTQSDQCPIEQWKATLDKGLRARIDARLDRLELGNFGDHSHIDDEIYELRFTIGPGYRIYYAIDNQTIVLLLNAGDKSTQPADIQKARDYWNDYRSQSHA